MRLLLWFLGLFAVAVASALFAGDNDNTVTLFWSPYRVDLSLNLVILSEVVIFVVLYAALRALATLLALPGQAQRWRVQHQAQAIHLGLLDTLTYLASGRFTRARKVAQDVLALERTLARDEQALPYRARLRAIIHLLAAEGAHALQDRAERDEHLRLALAQASRRKEPEVRDGLHLRAARWAFDDRDAMASKQQLEDLSSGAARRTLALRLRFKVARLSRETKLALETARLLAKHRAFSPTSSQSLIRVLALELIASAHDPVQLEKVWSQMDEAERAMPDVAIQAAQRLLQLGGEIALSLQWLLPIWGQLVHPQASLSQEQRVKLILVLERSFAAGAGQIDGSWLARIEAAQRNNPRDALLPYLAGVICMHLNLWGKSQQMFKQALPRLQEEEIQRRTWRALALLAEQREDTVAAAQAWRQAAGQSD